jgi:hypothetical protein
MIYGIIAVSLLVCLICYGIWRDAEDTKIATRLQKEKFDLITQDLVNTNKRIDIQAGLISEIKSDSCMHAKSQLKKNRIRQFLFDKVRDHGREKNSKVRRFLPLINLRPS